MKLVSNEILAVRKIKNAIYRLSCWARSGAVRGPYKEARRMRWGRKWKGSQLLKVGFVCLAA
jgi:hypothetical protein